MKSLSTDSAQIQVNEQLSNKVLRHQAVFVQREDGYSAQILKAYKLALMGRSARKNAGGCSSTGVSRHEQGTNSGYSTHRTPQQHKLNKYESVYTVFNPIFSSSQQGEAVNIGEKLSGTGTATMESTFRFHFEDSCTLGSALTATPAFGSYFKHLPSRIV